ncbi:hypothetical protein U6A24_04460 [Aquimarina gracilis]|uniref:Uncharacterized protein n=1 Tax=Aquimarina gracilis TaxID=874422 RepID=A0ABU5ZRN0_9FLAO|nr:hypothetical protein [Aquimarina gracilis]MEB3344698.1 hypothetical protein [Aquimarina gracilis]
MKSYSTAYRTFLQWLFTITILLGVGGYSNYTSPKSKDVTTEQLVSVHRSTEKSVSYAYFLSKRYHVDVIRINKFLIGLKDYHSKLVRTKSKELYSIFTIPQIEVFITLIHNNSYISEDSFHNTMSC